MRNLDSGEIKEKEKGCDAHANKFSRRKKTEQPVKVDDWADEILGDSEPLSAK